jgi:YhcG PDDEXK nuclease domain
MVGGSEYYPDLILYHFRLRCFVVIELKAVKFEPGFLGQLGMYMAVVDDVLRHPDDKPTIGLLLCKSKNDTVAEYALRGSTGPIGIAQWTTDLTNQLPDEIAASLPTVEELEAELAASDEGDAT